MVGSKLILIPIRPSEAVVAKSQLRQDLEDREERFQLRFNRDESSAVETNSAGAEAAATTVWR